MAFDATAFANRNSLFTIQFYTRSENPPFPDSGITFLDGRSLFAPYAHTPNDSSHFLGMVSSIVDNEPAGWDYGYVLEQQ